MIKLNDRFLKDLMDTNTFGHLPFTTNKTNFPLYNISTIETDENGNGYYFIEYALAGYSRDEIKLEEDSTMYGGHSFNVLKLTAAKNEVSNTQYYKQNIAYRDIENSIIISSRDRIKEATYKDGILTVHVERQVEKAQGRTINIE